MDAADIELVKNIHLYFRSNVMRLCLAESCTGGLISHLLTSQPGASFFFDSAVISYTADSKIKLLGVSKFLLKRYGIISEEAAVAMARGIRKKRRTDFSLSATGNIGPDVLEHKQVGLVYAAVDSEKETISRSMIFEGEREAIKYKAAVSALRLLDEAISRQI